ncbi:MAG: hypothetical protein ACRD2C_18300 [Acidimicrobiales bacterium]
MGWPLAFMIAVAVEPVPADPDAAPGPLLVQLAGLAFLLALGVTVIAAATRHASAAAAGIVTGLLATAFSITCPVTGHHAVGSWWFVQMGVTLAMLGASMAALGRRARVTS